MKIGIIKETKIPVDNRVALTPTQVAVLNKRFPEHQIVVQESDIRAFTDEEYRNEGVEVVNDLSDCDVLFGIKEAKIETLIPNKHYFFFAHIAKMQEYNRPLLQAMLSKNLTFSDYEYLVDENNQRVCAFGWWAGVVGAYYTLRGYGLRAKTYDLPKPDIQFTLTQLINNLKNIQLPAVKILVTGTGRVSQGVQYVLKSIGACYLTEEAYLTTSGVEKLSYTVASTKQLVKRKDSKPYERDDFKKHPENYVSDFNRWSESTDMLITAHFWGAKDPVYLTAKDLRAKNLRISIIGDVTCDIKGSIMATVRPATHSVPYFDYNPETELDEPPFSSEKNITVMAVDTCPNALALDTSDYFGKMLIEHVFEPLLQGKPSKVIERSTIVENGKLTEKFDYLASFALGH